MGGDKRTPPDPGHVDLAMTRYVLEGLASAGVPASDPAMQKVQVYLSRCQNPDGGFFFSTVNLETNKAGENSSYGSTTADGILALRAAGVSEGDERIQRAKKWLKDRHPIDRVPGFEGPREEWSHALRFYYAAAVTRAIPGLAVLLPPQKPDGSFKNPSNLVKEDDPLIATAFALRVLASNRRE
jgi:squalene-hopene/tetraprenyl-beta-curcumene cyclase